MAEKLLIGEAHKTKLKPGDKAPPITGMTEEGIPFDQKIVEGKKVVLYFYPKDDTAGCTTQACNLRDNYESMLQQGYAVIGVSPDSVQQHRDFIKKYQLPFPLIADPERKLIKAYDVWGDKTILGKKFKGVRRTTFVIDRNGIIEEVIDNVDTANHAEQVLPEGKGKNRK